MRRFHPLFLLLLLALGLACSGAPIWTAKERLHLYDSTLCVGEGGRGLAVTRGVEGGTVWSLDLETGKRRRLTAVDGAVALAADCQQFAAIAKRPDGRVRATLHHADGAIARTVPLAMQDGWRLGGTWTLEGTTLQHLWDYEAQAFDLQTGEALWGWHGKELRMGWPSAPGPLLALSCDHQAHTAPRTDTGVCLIDPRDGTLVEHADVPRTHVSSGPHGVLVLGPDALRSYATAPWAERWRVPVPAGRRLVGTKITVEGEMVLLGTDATLLVIDDNDGSVRYRREKRTSSDPSIAGGKVVWLNPEGEVLALDLATGSETRVLTMDSCGAWIGADGWPCQEWTDVRVAPPYVILGDQKASGAWRLD